MRIKRTTTVLLAVLAILLCGCAGESNCPLITIGMARFQFLDSQTHKAISFTQPVTVTGTATVADTLQVDTLFNQAKDYMSLPLSYTDRTTYVMHYTEKMRDTIEVTHRNIPYVSDIECPAMMYYHVQELRYTTNALDSVTLVNPEITHEEKVNFNIYYRTADAE